MSRPGPFPIRVPFSSKCIEDKSFVRGEARNKVGSDMIRYIFDTYCDGHPPQYSNWEFVNELVTTGGCKYGQKRLTAELLFRRDARIFCPATQMEYRNDGMVMAQPLSNVLPNIFGSGDNVVQEPDAIADHKLVVNKNRPYSTTYIYKDALLLKKITLPTDVDHKDDLIIELTSLDRLLVAYHSRGYSTAEVIETLEYISIQAGRFDGVDSVLNDFLAILEIRSDTSRLSEKEKAYFVKKLSELPLVGSKGEKIPLFAKYYYAYRKFSEELGTIRRKLMQRSD